MERRTVDGVDKQHDAQRAQSRASGAESNPTNTTREPVAAAGGHVGGGVKVWCGERAPKRAPALGNRVLGCPRCPHLTRLQCSCRSMETVDQVQDRIRIFLRQRTPYQRLSVADCGLGTAASSRGANVTGLLVHRPQAAVPEALARQEPSYGCNRKAVKTPFHTPP